MHAQPGRATPGTPAPSPGPEAPAEAPAPPQSPQDTPDMPPMSPRPQPEDMPAPAAPTQAPPGFIRQGLDIGPNSQSQASRAFHPAQGLSLNQRVGRDRRGLGQADTPAAAQGRATATLPAALPPQVPDNLLFSAGFMDWAPTASSVPSRPRTPRSDLSPPPPSPGEGPLHLAGGPREAPRPHLVSGSHLGAEQPTLSELFQPPAPSSADSYLPPQPMEGVETAILLPDEGLEGELVDLARLAAHDMTEDITPRQVDAAIAHVIRQEPSTWLEALAVGDSASCPHNLQVALRAYLEDICPEMRPGLSEEDLGPDPSVAYPTPSPAPEYPACPRERPTTAPAGPAPPGPASTPRRSSRESRPCSAWWQSQADPAPEEQGGLQ
jgi:hypothetical protein